MKKKILLLFLLLPVTTAIYPCTNLLISKGASKDGSVMISYCADSHTRYGTLVFMPAGKHKPGEMIEIREWGKERLLGKIPQVPYTYNVIGNMNENQVVIGETTWGGRKEFRDTSAILDYGSLIYITLQRAKTAKEAIQIFTSLANEYGYASSGESLSFGDKNEAWILEIIAKKPHYENGVNLNKGAVWVAVRIPDGHISAHANSARITSIIKNDPDNCLYAEDVISHARETGIYSGSDENFSFADVYCPLEYSLMTRCEARVWSFFNKYGDIDMSAYIDYITAKNPSNRMPLYVKAKAKLGVKEVSDMMRDHYEGTQFDMRKGVGAGGNELPYRWNPSGYKVDGVTINNPRAIATQQTGFWFIGQCRSWLPDAVGGLFWFAVDDAATSPLTPVYTCSNAISKHYALGNGSMLEYSPTSMFWMCNRIAQFAYLRYNQVEPEVRDTIDRHEVFMREAVNSSDSVALKMIKTGRKSEVSKYLTDISVNRADNLFAKWDTFDKYLLVKYMDGNIKRQNSDGSFLNNGYTSKIPPAPIWNGYSDEFKQSLKEETLRRQK